MKSTPALVGAITAPLIPEPSLAKTQIKLFFFAFIKAHSYHAFRQTPTAKFPFFMPQVHFLIEKRGNLF